MNRNRLVALGIALVLVAGFLAGRFSVPGLDPQILARADSLAATKKAYSDERALRLVLSDSLVAQTRQRLADSVAATAAAERLRSAGRVLRTEAQRLGRALDSAQTAGDSVPILVAQVGSLSVALDSTEAAADSFKAEVGRSREDIRNLILAVDVLRDQVRADSVRLGIQEGVIGQLRKVRTGCQVPLLGIKCPAIGPGYSATFAGGTVQHGISLSVVYPLVGGR